MLTVNNVTMSYDGKPVVNNVSFDVKQGDYLCIVGENGSGKTTLMKGILGLMRVNKGNITFSGFKQRDIGYLPQHTIVQRDFPASVFEVVLSGCLNRRCGIFAFYSAKDKKHALANIQKLNIESLKNKCYRELSSGQQQRVLLARALCATNKMLLLDEPVANLDPVMSAGFHKILARLNKEGITIIMISHDIKSAVKYGNLMLHMQEDSYFFGTTKEYIETPIYTKMTGGEKVV